MYTTFIYDYRGMDYNEPIVRRQFESREAAIQFAKAQLPIYYGRVSVCEQSPITGYHDTPAVWERERK
jgi:hypothetical protein